MTSGTDPRGGPPAGLLHRVGPRPRTGRTIGLLGGSFDPAHAGHLHVSRAAAVRFGLDHLWWLVSPANPLKARPPAPLEARMARARAIAGDDSRITVTDIESRLGTRLTWQTLEALRRGYPGQRFVWLMGADNLAEFHRWARWREIMMTFPIGVLARPGQRLAARNSPAARIFDHARLRQSEASRLAGIAAPAWCLIDIPMVNDSSTALRAAGTWPQGPESTAIGTGGPKRETE